MPMSPQTVVVSKERAAQLQAEKEKLIREAQAKGFKRGGDPTEKINWLYQKATEARADLVEANAKITELAKQIGIEKSNAGQPRPILRHTHTYAILEISETAFKEIAGKLEEAGYSHAFDGDGKECVIDMHGIAVQSE